jgi:hypothetical protein
MAGHTAREALLAEILGDVLKLHDAVTGLEAQLPELLKGLEGRITDYQESLDSSYSSLVAQLERASGDIRSNVELLRSENTASRKLILEDIQHAVSREIQGISSQIVGASKDEIRRFLDAKTATSERAEPKWGRAPVWLAVGTATVALLLGVMMGRAWGPVRDISAEEARYMEAGQDILEVMPRLPGDVRKRLEAALKDSRDAKQ